ncbi:MAG TPA: hypothetical protein V6C71_04925 [Coleofasciculaceae cyanobacterium]|jgi:hypothetical protein
MGDKDFFLEPDDAMTMGNINYMRKATRTKRTFPKTLKNKDGFAFDNEVSSIENRTNLYKGSNTNQNTLENTVFNPTPSSESQAGITGGSIVTQTKQVQPQTNLTSGFKTPISQPTQQSPEKRRQSDKSMDMFRNMAKGMRGRK